MKMLWAGTSDSFDEYTAIISKFEATSPSEFEGVRAEAFLPSKEVPTKLPRLLSMYGNLAVISIHGILTDTESWYNRYAGLVAYSEIREAMVSALSMESVKEILLYTKSPGGVVSGLHDTYEFVKKASSIKTITMYSDSVVASAATWITAPAKYKSIAADATAGSIGVIMRHVEYSKQMKADGVTATTIRSGEFKQLANSVEPLSKKAEADLQDKADHVYGVFVQAIADSYNTTYQAVDKPMADGQEFIGSQAVAVGLIDNITNFDSVIETIQKRIAKRSNKGGLDMKKRYAITAETLAALAAGADIKDMDLPELPAAEAAAGDDDGKGVDVVAEGSEVTAEGSDAEVDVTTEVEGSEVTAEGSDAEVEGSDSDDNSAFALLKTQLADKDVELFDAKVALKSATEKIESFDKVESSFKEVVAKNINNMTIALGGSANDDLSTSDSVSLLSNYEATTKRFNKTFKVGGVAETSTDEDAKPKTKATITRIQAAGLKAVKL